MRKKKQDGSALVLVLLFTLFFTVISGVTVLAVVGSFRANTAEEKYESLYYEADAGIEKAIALANMGEYNDPAFVEADCLTNPSKYEIDMNEAVVRFSVKKVIDPVVGNHLKIESTATDKTNSSITRTIKAKIGLTPLAGGSDLFRYSLCGSKVTVDSTGTFNMSESIINSSESSGILNGAAPIGPAEENVAFDLPDFDETKMSHVETLTLDVTGALRDKLFINSTNVTSAINSSIKRFDYVTIPIPSYSAGGVPFTIYLVNADKLYINAPGGFSEANMMIICSGDVIFNTMTADGVTPNTGTLTGCGIIGKNVTVAKGNVSIHYPPYNDLFPNRFGGWSPLGEVDLTAITNVVSQYAPNFGGGAGGGGGGAPGGALLPTDYE